MRVLFGVIFAAALFGCGNVVCDHEAVGEAAVPDHAAADQCGEGIGEGIQQIGSPCTVDGAEGRADADGLCCTGCLDREGLCVNGFPSCGNGGQSCCDDGNTCTTDACGEQGECFNWSLTNLSECGNGGKCLPEKGPDEPAMCCMGCITWVGEDLVCVDTCPNGAACEPGGRCR